MAVPHCMTLNRLLREENYRKVIIFPKTRIWGGKTQKITQNFLKRPIKIKINL
jgi:hypothetical protein